jgi:predicted nucleotidyltransferase
VSTADIDVDRDRLADICRRYGIAELSIFGSVLRGEDRAESDIDLLYVFLPDRRIGWKINRLQQELEDVFGRAVDLVPKRYLNPTIREHVLETARVLYAA